jgi:carbonic anhydrase
VRNLVDGIHQFRKDVFQAQRELFERLALGQNPEVLLVTCSDSRLDPGLITQTKPGDLFVLRNAGNMVPAFGASNGGEGPTIEYAVSALGVRDIIVCGHSRCGVMKALCDPPSVKELPLVANWLQHAEATRRIIRENYTDYSGDDLLNIAVQEHVLVQLENLQTHPSVAAKLARGDLALHGWVYKLETGEVYTYSEARGRFAPLSEVFAQPKPADASAAHAANGGA